MREFRRPRWIVLSVSIVVFVVLCVMLGFWQLDRLEERRSRNAVMSNRLAADPVAIADIDAALGAAEGTATTPEELEFTLVEATGSFVGEGGVFVRSQVWNGQAGTHGVYAFELADGSGVLVNVGWYPLGAEPASILDIHPGNVSIITILRATQERPAIGREEPDGILTSVARIDIERLARQFDLELKQYWLQLVQPDDPVSIPIAAELPELDEGSHLSYAVQWFSFAVIAIGGYMAMVRKELIRIRRRAAASG